MVILKPFVSVFPFDIFVIIILLLLLLLLKEKPWQQCQSQPLRRLSAPCHSCVVFSLCMPAFTNNVNSWFTCLKTRRPFQQDVNRQGLRFGVPL